MHQANLFLAISFLGAAVFSSIPALSGRLFRRTAAGIGLIVLAFSATPLRSAPSADMSRLRVLTINVWSGLDYDGFFRYGEYEPKTRRAERSAILLSQIRDLAPDVVFLQEANPVGLYSKRLAEALGYDEIHKVLNGGIKFGPVGLPVNFKEGVAILARKTLGLRRFDAWKLSGPVGLFGDILTVHFSEAVWALAGTIRVGSSTLFIVNVHLVSAPLDDDDFLRAFRDRPEAKDVPEIDLRKAAVTAKARNERRVEEVRKLIDRLKRLPASAPLLVAGDFNAVPDSAAVKAFLSGTGALDAFGLAEARSADPAGGGRFTWDPERNENIAYSNRPANASGTRRNAYGLLDAFDTTFRRRIDYLFLGHGFRPEDILAAGLSIHTPVRGVHASDHFGVYADVDVSRILNVSPTGGGSHAPFDAAVTLSR